MYKGPNYCILRAEQGAHSIKRQSQSNSSQNATIRRFGQKLAVMSFPLERVRRIDAQITAV
jgi:hypothetical protein